MEELKILFFVLGSFFGIEDGRILAGKTTVNVNPKKRTIEVIQKDLFTIIQSENDRISTLAERNFLFNQEEKETSWVKELDNFLSKKLTLTHQEKMEPSVSLRYSTETDLQAMGIWYDADKNQFSINHVPDQNITTKDGTLTGSYWVFQGEDTYSFTIEPFLNIPESYQKFKVPLTELR